MNKISIASELVKIAKEYSAAYPDVEIKLHTLEAGMDRIHDGVADLKNFANQASFDGQDKAAKDVGRIAENIKKLLSELGNIRQGLL